MNYVVLSIKLLYVEYSLMLRPKPDAVQLTAINLKTKQKGSLRPDLTQVIYIYINPAFFTSTLNKLKLVLIKVFCISAVSTHTHISGSNRTVFLLFVAIMKV